MSYPANRCNQASAPGTLPRTQQNVLNPKSQDEIVEDYRLGYPQYSALIGFYEPFHISRRFSRLRARLLLQKQYQIATLESRLDLIDATETKSIYLGSQRHDGNEERKKLLSDLFIALKEYDELLERNHRILQYDSPHPSNVANLRNWLDGNQSLAREDAAYLDADNDLLCISPCADGVLVSLELMLERILLWLWRCTGRRVRCKVSRDEGVYIASGMAVKRLTHAIAAWGVVLLLWLPVVAVNEIDKTLHRLLAIIASAALAIIIIAVLTKAKTWEMFVAAATYSAVLVVFITGSDLASSRS